MKGKRKVRFLLSLFLAVLFLGTVSVFAQKVQKELKVVTMGADLNRSQELKMFKEFDIFEESPEVKIIKVTNEEERRYLEDLIPEEQIGSKAISSAYVEILDKGSGIQVKTKNITYVTEQAYANALVTAGVKDAKVIVAAPFPVSGTAALTGLFKAYEEATNEKIPQKAKEVATEEMTTTTEIGRETGQEEKVNDLMQRVKETVVEKDLKEPQQVEQEVENTADDVDLSLTKEQKDKITQLMLKVKKLDLNASDLKSQLKKFLKSERVKSIWEKLKSLFKELWRAFTDWWRRFADVKE